MAFTTFSILSKLTPLKKYVHSANGMLIFNDEQSFTNVVECLYSCIKSLETANLQISDFNEYDYVLEQFENIMGHKSLRQYIARKVNGLLAIDELTDENDPNECFFPDPVLRSLVNTEFELRIGGKIVSLGHIQNDYIALKRDENYESPYVSMIENQKREQQSDSIVGVNCKTTGTSNGVTITQFWLTPKIGFTNVFSVRAKLEGDCDTNAIYTIHFEIFDSNGNSTDSFSETVSDIFASTLYYDRTYLGFQKAGKYKICVWIEREGTSCKSAKECCEFSIKEVKAECCKPTGKSENYSLFNNGKSRMFSKLMLVNTFVLPYSSISAKTENQKWIRNKWRTRRANSLTVRARGFYHRWSCTGNEREFDTKLKHRSNRRDVMVLHYEPMPIFVKKEKVLSGHSIIDGGSASDVRIIVKC